MKYDYAEKHMINKITSKRNKINDRYSLNMLKGGRQHVLLAGTFRVKRGVLRGKFLSSKSSNLKIKSAPLTSPRLNPAVYNPTQ